MKKSLVLIALLLLIAIPAMAARVASIPITHEPDLVYQAYDGDSDGTDVEFLGYNGTGADVITAVPGVLSIVPGTNWANFVGAAQEDPAVGYTIKNVVLCKEHPSIIQCADVFPAGTICQQGTPNIRLWWPLMYEVPGTTWTLTIIYGTSVPYDDDGTGPNPAGYFHVDVWTWRVEASLESMESLTLLFHEVPFGLDEVPLISDEELFASLLNKISDIRSCVCTGDPESTGLMLGDFEMEVMDACIPVSPRTPAPTGPGTGIANSLENPACCKILADAEFVGFDLGILQPDK